MMEKEETDAHDGHTVKFNVNVAYEVEKKDLKQPPVATGSKSKTSQRSRKEDDSRSFYVTYNIGPTCEGKSPVFSPDSNTWSCSHDVDVTSKLITDHFLGKDLSFQVYEMVKVEVEKKPANVSRKSLVSRGFDDGTEKKEMNVANTGLTAQQKQRAKAKREAFMTQEGKDDPALPTEGIPKVSQEKEVRPAKESQKHKDKSKDLKDNAAAHARVHSSEHHVGDGRESTSRGETPHPHHFDHPERHMTPGSSQGMRRTRSAISLANLTAMRPKTPPSPHHHEHPISTLIRRGSQSPANESYEAAKSDLHKQGEGDTSKNGKETGKEKVMVLSGLKDVRFVEPLDSREADTPEEKQKSSREAAADLVFQGHSLRRRSLSESRKVVVDSNNGESLRNAESEDHHRAWSELHNALLDPDAVLVRRKVDKAAKEKPKPKVRMVIETQRVLVGKASIDLTELLLGSQVAEAV
jgi:hypothetical protein